MDIMLSIAAFLLAFAGIAGCILPLLPGPLFSFGALLCAYACSYSTLSVTALVIWLAIIIVASLADYFLPALMTRMMGGTKAGEIGATIGMIVGMLLFFSVMSLILCPFIGAVIGELMHDRDNFGRALRSGLGSFVAFAVGTGLKLAVCVGILVHIIGDTWGPLKDWLSTAF